MKKYFVVLVLLVIFVICAVLGFSGAKSTWKTIAGSHTEITSTSTPGAAGTQHNILVIRVDDLESKRPTLLSTWIFFITYSDQPYMVMKILYPNSNSEDLIKTFSLDANGKLSPRFEAEVKKLNFPWDGYVIVDEQGTQKINEWILNQPVETTPYDPQNPPDGFTVYVYDSRQLTTLCQNLQGVSQRQVLMPWRDIIPTHLRSNLTFENIILIWDYLTQSTGAPYCEVIPWG